MASINLFKKLGKTETAKNRDGGYKPTIWYAPIDTFTSIKTPTATPTALGDKVKITTSHTFPTDEGFIALLSKKHSVTTKGVSAGDEAAPSMEWTFETTILGDSAIHQEQLEAQLNDECIFLVKDQDCINAGEFVQFGDGCVTPNIKLEFDGKTTKDGLKEYKLTGTVKAKKFWYSGALTEKP